MLWPPSTGPTKMCLMGTLRDNQYLFRTLWASRSPCDTWTLLASCRLWAVAPSLTAARAREPSRQAGAWEDGERDIYIIIYIITMLVLITHCHEVGLVYGILHLAPGTISLAEGSGKTYSGLAISWHSIVLKTIRMDKREYHGNIISHHQTTEHDRITNLKVNTDPS